MAKAPVKKVAKPAAAETKKPAVKKKAPSVSLEAASETALTKLKELNLDAQLQADIEWCLGSYRSDNNPVGLIETGERALQIFKTEQARKTKGITAKFISDLEKAFTVGK